MGGGTSERMKAKKKSPTITRDRKAKKKKKHMASQKRTSIGP